MASEIAIETLDVEAVGVEEEEEVIGERVTTALDVDGAATGVLCVSAILDAGAT